MYGFRHLNQCLFRSLQHHRSIVALTQSSSLSRYFYSYSTRKILAQQYQRRKFSVGENNNIGEHCITRTSIPVEPMIVPSNDRNIEVIQPKRRRKIVIEILTLNRPDAANAINKDMLNSLNAVIDDLCSDKKEYIVSCAIITSAHPKVFCAGADLKERSTMSQNEAETFVSNLRDTFERVARLPMPVIASIEGAAFGGGLELALAADLRIAGKDAKFGLTETSLAIIPGAGGTQRLPRLIGVARAKEMIYRARRITADEAANYGIIENCVAPGEAENEAIQIAKDISRNGPIAIRMAKQAIDNGLVFACNLEDALNVEKEFYSKVLPTNDRLEGLAAFRERREPVYNGE